MNNKARVITLSVIILVISLFIIGLLSGLKLGTPGDLTLLNVAPPNDTNREYYSIQPIHFTFSANMKAEDVKIVTEPTTPIQLDINPQDSKTLIVNPQVAWENGITKISILGETKSVDNRKLGQTFTYNIRVSGLPEVQDVEEDLGAQGEVLLKFVQQLPYKGTNFELSYILIKDTFELKINKNNKEAGQKEYEEYLKQNGIVKSWITKIDTIYE